VVDVVAAFLLLNRSKWIVHVWDDDLAVTILANLPGRHGTGRHAATGAKNRMPRKGDVGSYLRQNAIRGF
jgi:hypothetical protein